MAKIKDDVEKTVIDWPKEFDLCNAELQRTSNELDNLKLKIRELHEEWINLHKAAIEINSSRTKLIVKICNDIRRLLCQT